MPRTKKVQKSEQFFSLGFLHNDLNRKLAEQDRLKKRIQGILPGFLAEHCLHTLHKPSGEIIIYTDSAAWASKLKFYETAIIQAFSGNTGSANRVRRVRIRITMQNTWKSAHSCAQARIPSKTTISNLQQMAADSGDGPIKKSLARLADTLAKMR